MFMTLFYQHYSCIAALSFRRPAAQRPSVPEARGSEAEVCGWWVRLPAVYIHIYIYMGYQLINFSEVSIHIYIIIYIYIYNYIYIYWFTWTYHLEISKSHKLSNWESIEVGYPLASSFFFLFLYIHLSIHQPIYIYMHMCVCTKK